jgi:predicted DNA-binding transcriptional regulator AlpA
MQLIRWPGLQKLIGGEEKKFSRSTCDRWERDGYFPKRLRIGKNSVAWCLDDINRWIQERTKP